MQTYRHLYPTLFSFQNLLSAYHKARQGKRFHPSVERFDLHLEEHLVALQEELRSQTYRPGPYVNFYIHDPKRRLVSAAPFRDRVVHHALYNVLEPIYECRFIHDSYACRTGKGTHRAVQRCLTFLRQNTYVLKADIAQYFPSIDHAVLQSVLRQKVADSAVLWLIAVLLGSGRDILASTYVMQWFPGDDGDAACRPRGLPIGNLTSQFFGNVYLHELDMFVKAQLRWRHYIRYSDDFVLFSPDQHALQDAQDAITHFLERLRLRLHPKKSVILPVRSGLPFLGYGLFPTRIRLSGANVRRFVRRMRRSKTLYRQGHLSPAMLQRSVQSWIAHAAHADTYQLRKALFARLVF